MKNERKIILLLVSDVILQIFICGEFLFYCSCVITVSLYQYYITLNKPSLSLSTFSLLYLLIVCVVCLRLLYKFHCQEIPFLKHSKNHKLNFNCNKPHQTCFCVCCQAQFQFQSNLIELRQSYYQCQASHPTPPTPGTLLPVHSGS